MVCTISSFLSSVIGEADMVPYIAVFMLLISTGQESKVSQDFKSVDECNIALSKYKNTSAEHYFCSETLLMYDPVEPK